MADAAVKKKREAKTKLSATMSARGQRFVLLVGDEGGILIFMRGKKVVRRLFSPTPQRDHTVSLVELMQANPKVPLSILVDVMDQQYVRHSFPPVSIFSVGGLVKRRLNRDFVAEDLKGSLPLGRDKTGRKEWNFLLVSLANTPMIQQWLELVVDLPNELRGIYLTPVESQVYIPMLKRYMPQQTPAVPWQLLVTHNKISGFRQAVLKDGKLVFTRVTQAIDDAVAAVIAGNIEQEIINTLEYLRRLGFQENASLEMIVIAAHEVKESIDLKRFNTAGAVVLTPLEVAEMMGLEQAALSADRFGDVVMAVCFGLARKHVLKFQTAYAKQLAQFYTIRRGAFVLAGIAALLMGFAAMSDIVSAISNRSEASSVEDKRKPVQAKLAGIKRSIGGLNIDVAKKSAIVAAYDAYITDAPEPTTFVADLAPLLTPEMRITSLIWAPNDKKPDDKNSGSGIAKSPLMITVEMEFTAPFEDIEALSKAVEASVAMLKDKMPGYEIATGAFPWLESGGDQGLEISFDKKEEGLREGMNKIEIYFWPKPDMKKTPIPKLPPQAAPEGRL